MALGAPGQAARQAHGRLRPRRARLPDPRRPPPAALHALPRPGGLRQDRDGRRAHDRARDRPAARDLERVLPLLLRLEGRGAADARRPHVVLVHDGDGDRRARRRLRSSPTPIAHALRLGDDPWLVRAAFVGLWAQMNYEQLTSLFRVEERSTQFVIASVANVLITVGDDRAARRRPAQGPDRRRRRQLHRDALASTSSCSSTAATSSGSSSPATCFGR